MADNLTLINDLFTKVFLDITLIEENTLKKGPFNDLTVNEVHTLEAIGLHTEKTMSEVAKALKITVGTLTACVNKLVRKEYVIRQRKEFDRRVVFLKLTNKGKLLYRVHGKFHSEMIKELFVMLDESEIAVLKKTLFKLDTFLESKNGD